MESITKSENKIFKSAELNIEGNIIITADCIIQISSISSVWVGDIPKKSLPIVLMAILAFFGSILAQSSSTIIFGLILFGIDAFIVYRHFVAKKYFGLVIELNCGKPYSFISDDRNFLEDVLGFLQNILRSDINENIIYNISFKNNKIFENVHGSTIVDDVSKSKIITGAIEHKDINKNGN